MFTQADETFLSRQQLERALSNADLLTKQKAKTNAADIRKAIPTDDQIAHDVGVDAAALMTDSEAAQLTRLTVAKDAPALLSLMQLLVERAVVNLGEINAEREFQALTPNDFLPD